MFNSIQGQDGYKVKLTSIILPGVATDEAEYYFDVTEPVAVEQFVVYVDFQDVLKKEIIEIHRTSLGGTRFHYYQYNRSNPTIRHGVDAFVQINSMATYWNVLSKNVDSFGWIRKLANPGLKVKVYGGRISHPVLGDYDVQSSIITLSDNTTSYIYFNDDTSQFVVSSTEPSSYFVLGVITTQSGDITSILDSRANYVLSGIPASITEAQRDALTGIRNGVHIFNTTSGLLQFYAGGTRYNVPISGGDDPTPRLSENIEGKGMWATDIEFAAGTDYRDSAPLLPKPSQIKESIDDINSSIINTESTLLNSDYLAGENITKGESLFAENAMTYALATTFNNIGDVSDNTRLYLYGISSGTFSSTFNISLKKIASPSINLNGRLQYYNGSSWVDVDATNAIVNITPASVSTSPADFVCTFVGTFVAPTRGTQIRMAFYVGTFGSETIDGTNYYAIGYSTNNTTTRYLSKYNGTTETNTGYFPYLSGGIFESILLSKTSASYLYKLPNIVRLAISDYSVGSLVKYVFRGLTDVLTGLVNGSKYYIGDTPGTLSTSSGTITFCVGICVLERLNVYPTFSQTSMTLFNVASSEREKVDYGLSYLTYRDVNIAVYCGGTAGYGTGGIQFSFNGTDWYNLYSISSGGDYSAFNTGYVTVPGGAYFRLYCASSTYASGRSRIVGIKWDF